jgi:integrase
MEKPFRNATATDLRVAFSKMEKDGWITRRKGKKGKVKEYSSWTDKKFRDVIKKFYKVVFGNNEQYPEQVRWIKTKFTKDKSVKKLDMKKFLRYEQIKELIRITKDLQRKTLLAIGYELGARPGELLALTNLNFREEENGLWCTINESKTDERVIKIVQYRSLLKQWQESHPLNHLPIYPLWISEATNYKNEPLGIAGAEKIAEEMIVKVDPTKDAKLYTLRHSRATFLAKCWLE